MHREAISWLLDEAPAGDQQEYESDESDPRNNTHFLEAHTELSPFLRNGAMQHFEEIGERTRAGPVEFCVAPSHKTHPHSQQSRKISLFALERVFPLSSQNLTH